MGRGARLASEVYTAFLASALASGLRERQIGSRVDGLSPPQVLHMGRAGEQRRDNAERLSVTVRCSELFCLLELRREADEGSRQDQRILASDAQRDQWRRSLRAALAVLYP